MKPNLLVCVFNCCLILAVVEGYGQQINVASPFQSANHSFYENHGVNFGFSLSGGSGNGSRVFGLLPGGQATPNIGFNQGSAGVAIPAFGGFDPNSSARFGFGRRSANGSGYSLGFNLAKGSTRTQTSITPSLTLPNGGIGNFSTGQISPFVTSVVPVVGIDNGVTRAVASGGLRPFDATRIENDQTAHSGSESGSNESGAASQSSANYGDASVESIKAAKADAELSDERELQNQLQQARIANDAKDYRQARISLRKAIKLTDDSADKAKLRKWLYSLSGK